MYIVDVVVVFVVNWFIGLVGFIRHLITNRSIASRLADVFVVVNSYPTCDSHFLLSVSLFVCMYVCL